MILYHRVGRIAYITLNRPEKGNVINTEMAGQLIKAWIEFRDDDEAWVAILRGNGNTFCGGYDFKEIERKHGNWKPADSVIFGTNRVSPNFYDVSKPIIGALHGYIPGAGMYLALECDIKIAAEGTSFALPEPRFNLPTSFASLITKHMLRSHALYLMLTGSRLTTKQAYEMGIINEIASQEILMERAEEIAYQICKLGPMSVRAIKTAFYKGQNLDYEQLVSIMEELFPPIMNSEDVLEGRDSFFEKREPVWKLK
ncbi:MAG: enoyl-CoA hydratase/isomerase family protein [Syntrophomonadaceae bacterium]|jgi:enoyl-CoA hydratase/carnithine racemase